MKTFRKEVNTENRQEMIKYLKEHFRYCTMNSWNQSTSYAHNMKIYNLGLSREQVDKLYALFETENAYDSINELIHEFGEMHNWEWQAGFNGRSCGYLVLYQGGVKDSEYKSYCTKCGQKNFKTVEETGNCRCGRCGRDSRINYAKTPKSIFTYHGRSIDMDADYEDWTDAELQRRVRLVQDFDELAECIAEEAEYMADNCVVKEEEYTVVRTRKVAYIC